MRAGTTRLGHRFCDDRRGATAVEYALIGSLVAGAAMASMIALGISLDLLFTTVADQLVTQAPTPPDDPARCIEVGSNCPK